jgi:5-methylcytosine-specific restriction endonuclease McrA
MTTTYIRLKKCPIEDTLKAIKEHKDAMTYADKKERNKRVDIEGVKVKLSSLRLITFATYGTECADCGIQASHFAFERHPVDENYHLNLWAVCEDGTEVLMTHDHILARSLGGADHISNTQPMCMVCNFEKGKIEHKLKAIRKKKKNMI